MSPAVGEGRRPRARHPGRHRPRGGDVRLDGLARPQRPRLRVGGRARAAARCRRAARLRPERVGADAEAADEPRGRRRRLRPRQPVLRQPRRRDRADAARGRLPDGARLGQQRRVAGARLRPDVPGDARGGRDHHTRPTGRPQPCSSRSGVDVVEVDRRLADVPCDAVVIDNERGAQEATAHLLELGHRRVALLVADTDWTSDAGRLHGYSTATSELGVPVDERLILPLAFHAPDAEERIAALLGAEQPTAIFAANNVLAEHAWHVLRGSGSGFRRTSRSSASTTCRGWRWSSPGSRSSPSRASRWAGGPPSCCCGASLDPEARAPWRRSSDARPPRLDGAAAAARRRRRPGAPTDPSRARATGSS